MTENQRSQLTQELALISQYLERASAAYSAASATTDRALQCTLQRKADFWLQAALIASNNVGE